MYKGLSSSVVCQANNWIKRNALFWGGAPSDTPCSISSSSWHCTPHHPLHIWTFDFYTWKRTSGVNARHFKFENLLLCKSLQGPFVLGQPVVLNPFHHHRLVRLFIPVAKSEHKATSRKKTRPFNEFFGWDLMDADPFQPILNLVGRNLETSSMLGTRIGERGRRIGES